MIKFFLINKFMIQKILLTILAALVLFQLSAPALAAIQMDDDFRPDNLPTYQSVEATDADHPETAATQTLILFVGKILSRVLLFAGSVSIVFMIIAGARYIFAFGKDNQIENAKRGIFWSVAGLVIVMLSYAIIQGVIQIILKVDESVN